MSPPLVLALPSKGRLQEQSEALLASVGFVVEKRDGRNYRARIAGRDDIEVAFLSASEIARELAAGSVHLGITGEDLVRETVADANERIALLTPLGFGHADVVVAVPDLWIDVWTMEDLDDVAASFRSRHGRRLRIATKYWNLTQTFFASHGIALYRVVESLGATEGAPAAGAADAIVDITTTGLHARGQSPQDPRRRDRLAVSSTACKVPHGHLGGTVSPRRRSNRPSYPEKPAVVTTVKLYAAK
jgi:ATP phosphoribosyltransferase